MESSAVYWSEMLRLRRKIDNQKEKLEKYKEYLPKLNKLNRDFHPTISQMRMAETNFANGGYVSGGQTLTEGKLLTLAEHLSNVESNLQYVIKGTEQEIENIIAKIASLEASHQQAENNYIAAKAAEDFAAGKK